jgi:hypothetical protein
VTHWEQSKRVHSEQNISYADSRNNAVRLIREGDVASSIWSPGETALSKYLC